MFVDLLRFMYIANLIVCVCVVEDYVLLSIAVKLKSRYQPH